MRSAAWGLLFGLVATAWAQEALHEGRDAAYWAQVLSTAYDHFDYFKAEKALLALDRASIPYLVARLEDVDPEKRFRAAMVLSRLGPSATALAGALATDPSKPVGVRGAAAFVLAERSPADRPMSVPMVKAALAEGGYREVGGEVAKRVDAWQRGHTPPARAPARDPALPASSPAHAPAPTDSGEFTDPSMKEARIQQLLQRLSGLESQVREARSRAAAEAEARPTPVPVMTNVTVDPVAPPRPQPIAPPGRASTPPVPPLPPGTLPRDVRPLDRRVKDARLRLEMRELKVDLITREIAGLEARAGDPAIRARLDELRARLVHEEQGARHAADEHARLSAELGAMGGGPR